MPLLTTEEIVGDMIPRLDTGCGRRFVDGILHLLGIDSVNDGYDKAVAGTEGGPACAAALLKEFGASYTAHFEDGFTLPEGPFVTVSNHPYGGMDGIVLIDLFGHLRPDYKVMVNRFLGRVKALGDNFITVVPAGNEKTAPQAASINGVRETIKHVKEGHPVGFLPPGAVSNLYPFRGRIEDRPWQVSVLRLIRRLDVPVIPVHFHDRNSILFYLLGILGWKVRTLRLPGELLNKGRKTHRVSVGNPVSVDRQHACGSIEEYGQMLREAVYGLDQRSSARS
ncbi:MAG: 1-acyl-sn-glycerol-3-phosphate acyltransferase [Bacteroidales bacterium]|nr:1-acyl-sn-glycerol-3-phosphate acyltransferase [Bacteroidales bacterium]